MSARLGRIGNRQLGDRAEPGAERRRLGHAARQQSHGQSFVEAEDAVTAITVASTADGHDQRQHDLRQRRPSSGSRKTAGRPNTRSRTGTGRRTPSAADRAVRVSPGCRCTMPAMQRPDHGPEADTLEVKAADEASRAGCSGTGTGPESRGGMPRAAGSPIRSMEHEPYRVTADGRMRRSRGPPPAGRVAPWDFEGCRGRAATRSGLTACPAWQDPCTAQDSWLSRLACDAPTAAGSSCA